MFIFSPELNETNASSIEFNQIKSQSNLITLNIHNEGIQMLGQLGSSENSYSLDGSGINIAIFGTGFDSNHPLSKKIKLKGGVNFTNYNDIFKNTNYFDSNYKNHNISINIDKSKRYSTDKNNDYSDLIGSGTYCASVIRSLSLSSNIYMVKVLKEYKDKDFSKIKSIGMVNWLIRGLDWCIKNKINVICLPAFTYTPLTKSDQYRINKMMVECMKRRIIVVDSLGQVIFYEEESSGKIINFSPICTITTGPIDVDGNLINSSNPYIKGDIRFDVATVSKDISGAHSSGTSKQYLVNSLVKADGLIPATCVVTALIAAIQSKSKKKRKTLLSYFEINDLFLSKHCVPIREDGSNFTHGFFTFYYEKGNVDKNFSQKQLSQITPQVANNLSRIKNKQNSITNNFIDSFQIKGEIKNKKIDISWKLPRKKGNKPYNVDDFYELGYSIASVELDVIHSLKVQGENLTITSNVEENIFLEKGKNLSYWRNNDKIEKKSFQHNVILKNIKGRGESLLVSGDWDVELFKIRKNTESKKFLLKIDSYLIFKSSKISKQYGYDEKTIYSKSFFVELGVYYDKYAGKTTIDIYPLK